MDNVLGWKMIIIVLNKCRVFIQRKADNMIYQGLLVNISNRFHNNHCLIVHVANVGFSGTEI
jgi:hypothetical protein